MHIKSDFFIFDTIFCFLRNCFLLSRSFQIVPREKGEGHNVTLWCFNKNSGHSSWETLSLGFDASLAEHGFQLDYTRSPIEGWDMRLLVDSREVVAISGGLFYEFNSKFNSLRLKSKISW